MNNVIASLASPKPGPKYPRNKVFLLNVILLGAIAFSLLISILSLFKEVNHDSGYDRMAPSDNFFLTLVLCFSLVLSKKGLFRTSSSLFVGAVFVLVAKYLWDGSICPSVGLLAFIAILATIGILMDKRALFASAFFLTSSFLAVLFFSGAMNLNSESGWHNYYSKAWTDGLVYVSSFLIAMLFFWLYLREMENCLQKARKYEKALEVERSGLKLKIEERIKEMKDEQVRQMSRLFRLAEFGHISAGLFHDLINPLTAVSLNLENINMDARQDIRKTQKHLREAISATEQMGKFVQALKKHVQLVQTEDLFSPAGEIEQVMLVLAYKARKGGVRLEFRNFVGNLQMEGDPIKFHQIATNLVSNAIDAYSDDSLEKRVVMVRLSLSGNRLKITVADNGKGIPEKYKVEVFDPFFTTKRLSGGSGIGLFTAKKAVEEVFKGEICFRSRENSGTIFTVKIPLKKEFLDYREKRRPSRGNG